MTDARRGLLRSIWFNYLAKIIPFPAVFLINLGIARIFGAEVLGQVALLLLFTTFVSYGSRLTTGVGLVHAISAYPTESKAPWHFTRHMLVRSVPIMLLTAMLVGLAGMVLLDKVYEQRQLWPVLWLMIIVFACFEHIWGAVQSAFMATQKMHLFMRVETLAQYGTLAFLITLALWAERSALFAALYRVFFAVTAAGFGVWFMLREARRARDLQPEREATYRQVIGYGFRGLPRQLADMLMRNGDRLLIPIFLPMTHMGWYTSAFSVFAVLASIARLPSRMLFVSLSRMSHEGADGELLATFRDTQRYIVLLGWPIIIAAMCLAEPIMDLFGPGFRQGAPALRLLLGGALIHSIGELTENILMAKSRPQWASAAVTCGALANVPLNLLLIPMWGLQGAAFASLSGYATMTILVLLMSGRTMKRHWWSLLEGRRILKVLLAGAPLVAMCVASLGVETAAHTALYIVGGFAASALVAVLIRTWTRQDLAPVLRLRKALAGGAKTP